MFTHNRRSIDLNGAWKFNPDPYQRCKQQKWWEGECPEIVGYVPWSLMDVRVPMHWRWYNRGSATFAYGFLDNDYNKKPIYDVVKDEIAKLKAHWEGSERSA